MNGFEDSPGKEYRIEPGTPRYEKLYSEGKYRVLNHAETLIANLVRFYDNYDQIVQELRKYSQELLKEIKWKTLVEMAQTESYNDTDVSFAAVEGDDFEMAHKVLEGELEETIRVKGMLGLAPEQSIQDFLADVRNALDNVEQDRPQEAKVPFFEEDMPMLADVIRENKLPDLTKLSDERVSGLMLRIGILCIQFKTSRSLTPLFSDELFLEVSYDECLERLKSFRSLLLNEIADRKEKSFDEIILQPADKEDVILEALFKETNTARITLSELDQEAIKKIEERFSKIQSYFAFTVCNSADEKKFEKLRSHYNFEGNVRDFAVKSEMVRKIIESVLKTADK